MNNKESDMEVDYGSDYDAESGALDFELTAPPDDDQMKKIMRLIRTLKFDELKKYLKESSLELTKARLKKNNQSMLFYCFDIGDEDDCLKALKILVSDFRLNPKRSDDIQQTLLFYAGREGYNAVIDWLIDTYKLSINKTDMYGQTPIYYAGSKGQKTTLLKLIDLGADCGSIDLENQTPLFFAARNGHTEICKILIDKGGPINQKDHKGVGAIDIAQKFKRIDTVNFLIDQGADVPPTWKMTVPKLHK